MLSVIMLNVVVLSVVMPNVIVLSVVAPLKKVEINFYFSSTKITS